MRVKLGSFIGVVVIAAALIFHSVIPWANAASVVRTDGPPGDPTTWALTFHDDFTHPTLDTAQWSTCYWWSVGANGCAGTNGELERYLPQNVTQHDGLLDLQALQQTYALNGHTYPYTSGMVTTAGKYSYLYGYMEARIKVPAGQGYWPAFWALAADHTRPTELDAMELLGHDPTTIYMGAHYADSQQVHHHKGSSWTGPDFSATFHTIGVDWAADHLTFYVDGVARYTITDAAVIPQRALYLILNLAVGGTWPGAPDASTAFPGHILVDWVRVWQQRAAGTGPTATPGASSPTPTETPVAPPSATVTSTPTIPTPTLPTSTGTPPMLVTPSTVNNTGVTNDQATHLGDLDGYGNSYSAQALAAAGFVGGTTFTAHGLHFRWPDGTGQTASDYLAQGQTLTMLHCEGVTTLGLIGAATGQAARGEGRATFTDGTSQPFTLLFDDWTLNGSTTLVSNGDQIVATMPYHNTANGRHAEKTLLFMARVPLPPGKVLRSFSLPGPTSHGHLHIFAIGTDAGTATPHTARVLRVV